MQGKIVLITGASDGIGKRAAQEFATLGATVIMHGRNPEKTSKAVEEVKQKSGSEQVDMVLADFASFTQIKQMSDELHEKYDRLDVLVNNAGVQMQQYELSEDGYEKTIAINHLSYFLLTSYLMDLVNKSSYKRIINVASGMHYRAELDFNNLQAEKGFSLYPIYAQSKLCNVMFTYYLADKLSDTGITVNTIHPGLIDTNLNPQRTPEVVARALPVEQGIVSIMRTATDEGLAGVTGKYFDNHGQETLSAELSYDVELQEKLWQKTEELVGRPFVFP